MIYRGADNKSDDLGNSYRPILLFSEVPRSPYKIGGPLRWSIGTCYGHLRGPPASLGALRASFKQGIGPKKLPKSSDLMSAPL